jgi:hypothetical protein
VGLLLPKRPERFAEKCSRYNQLHRNFGSKNEVTKDHVRQESSVSDFLPYRIVEMIKDDTDFRFARPIVLSLTRCTNRLRQGGPDPLWNITLTPGGEGAQRIYTVRRVTRGHLSGAPKIEFS